MEAFDLEFDDDEYFLDFENNEQPNTAGSTKVKKAGANTTNP